MPNAEDRCFKKPPGMMEACEAVVSRWDKKVFSGPNRTLLLQISIGLENYGAILRSLGLKKWSRLDVLYIVNPP